MNIAFEFQSSLSNLRSRLYLVLSVVVTLGVTLGILLCMSALSNLVFVKPLSYPDSNRLFVAVGERFDKGELSLSGFHSYPGVEYLYKNKPPTQELGLMNFEESLVTNLPGRPKMFVTYTTPEFFRLTGASMALGRAFAPKTAPERADPVAVISYSTWMKEFGGRADVLEQKLTVNDISFSIIGVLSRNFVEPSIFENGRETKLWLPWKYNSWDEEFRTDWQSATGAIRVIGVLQNGMNAEQTSQALSVPINKKFKEETIGVGFLKDSEFSIRIASFTDIIVGDGRNTALLLLAGSLALLLIACVNVSNLLLSRAAERQRQLAIQATLGATVMHIFGSVYVECFILMIASALFALLVSSGAMHILKEVAGDQLPRMSELGVDIPTVAFALLLAGFLALIFSAIISRMVNYRQLSEVLKSSGKGSGLQISGRSRNILIISQISLAAILLTGNLNLLNYSLDIINRPAGFRTEGVIYTRVITRAQKFSKEERIYLIDEIKEELMALPAVEQVSNSIFVPMMTGNWNSLLSVDKAGTIKFLPNTNLVDANYLPVMGIDIVQGRNFFEEEVKDKSQNIIVNEMLAKKLSSDGDVLGKRFYWQKNEEPYEVVGVAKGVFIPRDGDSPTVYVTRSTGFNFVIRMKPNQTLEKDEFAIVLGKINRQFAIDTFQSVQDVYDGLLARDKAIVSITAGLSLLTLLLAGLGTYGVLSYSIRLRRYELGVRMAIGANPSAISTLVFKDSGKTVGIGFAIGVVSIIVIYAIAEKYFGLKVPLGALPSLGTFMLIAITSILACWLPLRGIVKNQPIGALRDQ